MKHPRVPSRRIVESELEADRFAHVELRPAARRLDMQADGRRLRECAPGQHHQKSATTAVRHGVITTPRAARSLSIAAIHTSISGVCFMLSCHLSRVPAGTCSRRTRAASSETTDVLRETNA